MDVRRSSRIQALALTRPISPNLLTRGRPCQHYIESQEDKDNRAWDEIKKYKFTAKPAPKCTFTDEPVGIPKKKVRKGTKASTPMAMKRKAVSRSVISKSKKNMAESSNNAMKRLRALPLPDLKNVFEVEKNVTKTTKSEPFSFDKREPHPNEIKEKLVKETLEKEKNAREFKANPLYESSGFVVDKSLSKPCTQIEPFKISKPDFYDEKLKRQAERVQKENEDLKKKTEFKARYPHVLYEPAFEPVKDSRMCDLAEFNLHSANRGIERKKFDVELEEQRLMYEQLKMAEEDERKLREAEVVKELRKKLVHRANQVGEYKKQDYEDAK